jgi:hypothetical protein
MRKKTMKKKKTATRLKAKKMKTTLLGATPRRTRYFTTPTKSKLLEKKHINITTPPEFRIKRISRPGREEYKAVVEIISGPNVLSRHKGPAYRTTYPDAVADAAWQAITTYSQRYHDELRNTVYHLLPQRKKNQFKVFGVKADVLRMLMVHHQDMFVEMSTCLQTAQQEIQKLRDQLRDSDATIRAY